MHNYPTPVNIVRPSMRFQIYCNTSQRQKQVPMKFAGDPASLFGGMRKHGHFRSKGTLFRMRRDRAARCRRGGQRIGYPRVGRRSDPHILL